MKLQVYFRRKLMSFLLRNEEIEASYGSREKMRTKTKLNRHDLTHIGRFA